MDQVALAIQNSVEAIGKISANLAHPQTIRRRRDSGNFDPSRRKVDKEQHHESLQPSPGLHFHREEIRGHDQLPMLAQKLLPGRLPTSLWRRLDAVSLQNLSDRAPSNLAPEIGQGTLNPSIAPIAVFFCEFYHQGFEIHGRSRTP
jgi:hypothetical protein